jgi:hypothetical protein
MSITVRQQESVHLSRLKAYSHRYRVAGRWRAVRRVGTLLLAVLGPVFSVAEVPGADVLAATAAGWLLLGRASIQWCETPSDRRAVQQQQLYETELFRLPWNSSLAGPLPNAADLNDDARRLSRRVLPRLQDWFNLPPALPHEVEVLRCQLQSSVWSRRDHRAYALTVGVTAGTWIVGAVLYACLDGMTLSKFLVALFLPSAPALVDAADLAMSHWRQFRERLDVETRAQDALQTYEQSGSLPAVALLVELQDAAYRLRREQPRVPGWFYWARRHTSALVAQST